MSVRTSSRKSTASGRSRKTALKSFTGAKSKSSKDDSTDDDIRDLVPKGLAGAYVSSKLHEKKVREAGLTPPGDFKGEMPELPDDIDAVDHSVLSNLIMSFQNALSTATWQASMRYIEHDIYEEIAEYLENRALLSSTESNDTKRKADAKTDDKVVRFSSLSKEAYRDYVRFRDLGKTIEGKIKVLSRVGGFKDDENDASDRNAKPKMSRGASRRRSRDD
jgi:hypothetical protein